MTEDKLCLTIDEYLSIYMFIIVKARLKDLVAHFMMMESFLSEYALYASRQGQVFLTVMQASQFLKEMDENKISDDSYLKTLASEGIQR